MPLKQGDSVEEIFGLPPLFPLSVSQDKGQCRVLSFYSPNGLTSIASDCRITFTINCCSYSQFSVPQSKVSLEMSFEALSPIAQIAVPALIAGNYFALKILLPRALRKRQTSFYNADGIGYSSSNIIDEIIYRPIIETDISQLAVLVSNSFDTTSADSEVIKKSISQYEIDLSTRLQRLVLEESSNYHLMLGAFNDENECVGFLEMGMQPVPEGIDRVVTTNDAVLVSTIGTVAVSKSYQRQGIARRLMIFAEDEIKLWQAKYQVKSESKSTVSIGKSGYVFSKIICSVDSTNYKAVSLYINKLGYEQRGTTNVTVRRDGEEENKKFLLLCKEI